jgi:hypothetical protein
MDINDVRTVTTTSSTGPNTYYMIDCPLNALEIADTVTATLTYGDGQTVVDSYSLIQYCEYIRNHASKYNAVFVNVVDAVQNYGHYLQTSGWTDKNRHNPIDAVAGKEITDASVETVKTALADDTYDFVKPTNNPSLEAMRFSLSLKSAMTINLYYKLSSGSIADAETVEIDGETWYLVKMGPLAPKHCGASFPVLGEGANAGSVSVLSYVKAILNSSSASITSEKKYAMVALYEYYNTMLDIEKWMKESSILN